MWPMVLKHTQKGTWLQPYTCSTISSHRDIFIISYRPSLFMLSPSTTHIKLASYAYGIPVHIWKPIRHTGDLYNVLWISCHSPGFLWIQRTWNYIAGRKHPDCLADSCKRLSVNQMAADLRLSRCNHGFFTFLQLFQTLTSLSRL